MERFRCVNCLRTLDSSALAPACGNCGSSVLIEDVEVTALRRDMFEGLPAGVWRYKALLPEVAAEDLVTLGEGGTPMLRAERLGHELGLNDLFIKDESRNPTGSFMDRGSTVLLSLAKKRGMKECTCVTTGNLGASLAAYCAKAGLKARIRVHPNTDQGKLYQMLAYGADIEATTVRHPSRAQDKFTLAVTAGNPYLLEGEKSTAFELVQDLGWKTPDAIVVPVGTGGHLSMIWRAIVQLRLGGLLDGPGCRLIGVQLGETSPNRGRPRTKKATFEPSLPVAELERSEPFFRKEANMAIKESKGMAITTTPNDALVATGLLARSEGIFAEPASASVVASLAVATRNGDIRKDETVVCIITGAGLKDTKAVSRLARETRRVAGREPYALPGPQIGETKFLFLRLLNRRPAYGYELWREIGSERKITTASVYQHLEELEGFGMVRRRGSVTAKGRERIFYELTKKGADFLRIAGQLERSEITKSK